MPDINGFKQAALEQGYSQDEIDSFVSSIDSGQLPDEQPGQQKSFSTMMAETGQQSTLDQMGKQGLDPSKSISSQPQAQIIQEIPTSTESGQLNTPMPEGRGGISEVIGDARMTQPYGKKSNLEKYSGGTNLGTDWAVPSNTALPAPKTGDWTVIKANPGWNDGSGNIVTIQSDSGEKISYEHLNRIGVQPGQKLNPSQVVGLSGGGQSGSGRGNSTGNHASIPYQDARGNYKDIRNTPYF